MSILGLIFREIKAASKAFLQPFKYWQFWVILFVVEAIIIIDYIYRGPK